MTVIGEVDTFPKTQWIEWKIKNFSLSGKECKPYWSPEFSLHGESWNLVTYMNASNCSDSPDCDDSLYLVRNSGGSSINVKISVGLKTINGEKQIERDFTKVFGPNESTLLVIPQFISKAELEKRWSELVPFGTLTFICSMTIVPPTRNENDYNEELMKEQQAENELDLESDMPSEAEFAIKSNHSLPKRKRKSNSDGEQHRYSSSDEEVVITQFSEPPPKKSHFLPHTFASGSISTPHSRDLLELKENLFEKNIIKLVEKLKEEIRELKEMLITKSSISLPKLPNDCPSLPIDTAQNMQKFEVYLKLEKNFLSVCEYFSTIGGNDVRDNTRRTLSRMMSNSLSQQYNWKGSRGNKLPFFLFKNINRLIFGVIRKNFATTEVEVQAVIKNWLMHAKDRDVARGARRDIDIEASDSSNL